jgi:hypothetical protein
METLYERHRIYGSVARSVFHKGYSTIALDIMEEAFADQNMSGNHCGNVILLKSFPISKNCLVVVLTRFQDIFLRYTDIRSLPWVDELSNADVWKMIQLPKLRWMLLIF